jgi:hypothetical protein
MLRPQPDAGHRDWPNPRAMDNCASPGDLNSQTVREFTTFKAIVQPSLEP